MATCTCKDCDCGGVCKETCTCDCCKKWFKWKEMF